MSPNRHSCSLQSHIVSESRRNYHAGIITVVIISTELQCLKTGSLQAAIMKLSLGSNKFVDISSGLSQNWSFFCKFDQQKKTAWVKNGIPGFFVNFTRGGGT